MSTTESIARLREALAAGPTPGARKHYDDNAGDWPPRWHWCAANEAWHEGTGEDDEPPAFMASVACGSQGDAMLIAACDPAAIAALLAAWDEREALRKDAERYRWLKSKAHKDWEMFTLGPVWFVPKLPYAAQTLDAAIDAAMKEPQ